MGRTSMSGHEVEGGEEGEDKGEYVHGWACQRLGWSVLSMLDNLKVASMTTILIIASRHAGIVVMCDCHTLAMSVCSRFGNVLIRLLSLYSRPDAGTS
jgi:hypothetical protein